MQLAPRTKKAWLRATVGILTLLALLGYFVLIPLVRYWSYSPRVGDVVFQSLPQGELVAAIEGATGSPYSHCGVVVKNEGKWAVIESIGSVRITPLFRWIMRGRGRRFAAYRLKAEHRHHLPEFIRELHRHLGKPYDYRYRMDDRCTYCSELVYKAYESATGHELGTPVEPGDLHWQPFETMIRRYEGGRLPLKRGMITPRGPSEAEQLQKVFGGDF